MRTKRTKPPRYVRNGFIAAWGLAERIVRDDAIGAPLYRWVQQLPVLDTDAWYFVARDFVFLAFTELVVAGLSPAPQKHRCPRKAVVGEVHAVGARGGKCCLPCLPRRYEPNPFPAPRPLQRGLRSVCQRVSSTGFMLCFLAFFAIGLLHYGR